MQLAIPTKLDERLVRLLDELVSKGLYTSRSEAIRDAVRRLIARLYVSTADFLRTVAQIAAEVIVSRFERDVTGVVLFGSVARGSVSLDSDIDLLILARDGASVPKLRRMIHEAVYPISLASDVPITLVVITRRRFAEMLEAGCSFANEVAERGVQLCGDALEVARG